MGLLNVQQQLVPPQVREATIRHLAMMPLDTRWPIDASCLLVSISVSLPSEVFLTPVAVELCGWSGVVRLPPGSSIDPDWRRLVVCSMGVAIQIYW